MKPRAKRPWRSPAIVSCTFLFSIIAHASCRLVVGLEERDACEASEDRTPPCLSCVLASCCEQVLSCRQEPLCAALEACLAACHAGDEKCRAACRIDHPTGPRDSTAALAFTSLSSCRARSCATDCGLACGGYLYPDEECAECAQAEPCCEQATACSTSTACLALASCERGCGTADHDCRADCQLRHPEGLADARAFAECLTKHCQSECGLSAIPLGPDWSCLEDGQPAPSGPGPDAQLVVQFSNKKEGVFVCPCEKRDFDCNYDPQICVATDTMGTATLTVRRGFDGYVEGHPGDSGLMGFVAYLDRPVEEHVTLQVSVLTPEQYAGHYGHVAPPLEAKGQLYLYAADCSEKGAPGLSFALRPVDPEGSAVPYYGQTGDYPCCATPDENGQAGYGGFVNVTPGVYQVMVIRRDNLQCVAAPEVVVRPGKETQLVPDDLGPESLGGILPAPWSCPEL